MRPSVTLSRDLADRFTSQSRDLWEVCLDLDTEGNPVADRYSRDATRYAVCAGYLRARVGRSSVSEVK